MKIIYNDVIPFPGFRAMNICGVIFARKKAKPLSAETINHEAIHTAQMKELAYIFFYIIYVLEWLYRLVRSIFTKENAYRSISFEREAYDNDDNMDYLQYRQHYAQWRRK